jgi:hypothetical protein
MNHMRKLIAVMGILFLAVGMLAVNTVSAGNITIFDTLGTEGSPGINIGHEDQETEPNTLTPQKWDLEAFLRNGTTISMVGGYDFQYGATNETKTYMGGDLFIANKTAAAPLFGSTAGAFTGSNKYGYNYVVTTDFDNNKYYVYAIGTGTAVYSTTDIAGSNPWKASTTGLTPVGSGDLVYKSSLTDASLTDANTGFVGGTRYELDYLGLGAWLTGYTSDPNYYAWFHYTYECGNDLLMGQAFGSQVPLPPSALLLGTGLLGLVGLRWRRSKVRA